MFVISFIFVFCFHPWEVRYHPKRKNRSDSSLCGALSVIEA
jgi:hypothetical protein